MNGKPDLKNDVVSLRERIGRLETTINDLSDTVAEMTSILSLLTSVIGYAGYGLRESEQDHLERELDTIRLHIRQLEKAE